jgi:hypothetical protein
MYYDLSEIRVLDGNALFVRFEDGLNGTVDLSDWIGRGGVFERLKDRSLFKQAYIDPDWKVVCWPGEIDIAPETLYQAVRSKTPAGPSIQTSL